MRGIRLHLLSPPFLLPCAVPSKTEVITGTKERYTESTRTQKKQKEEVKVEVEVEAVVVEVGSGLSK